MTDRKEKLAVLADYAEELGLADVAEMLRTDFPRQPNIETLRDGFEEVLRASRVVRQKSPHIESRYERWLGV